MAKSTNGYGYAPDYIQDQLTVMRPNKSALADNPKCILFCHGVTGSSLDVLNSTIGLWQHLRALTDAGYVVISGDWAGPQGWSGPLAMAKFPWVVAAAFNNGATIGTLNAINGHQPKVALMGGSMGGLTVLNLYKRFASQIAGALLWNPVTDLRWADTEAGYTPAYATGGLVGSWAASIVSAYPISTLITGTTVTLNQGGQTLNVVDASGFSASGTVTIAGITVTYTGKGSTTLTGCTVASGTLAVAANYVVTQGSGAYANSVGYRVVDEYATWKSKTIKVIHASDDATVPNQASQAFVTGVADAGVTFRSPQPTGGHINVFQNVPTAETVAFFNGLSW